MPSATSSVAAVQIAVRSIMSVMCRASPVVRVFALPSGDPSTSYPHPVHVLISVVRSGDPPVRHWVTWANNRLPGLLGLMSDSCAFWALVHCLFYRVDAHGNSVVHNDSTVVHNTTHGFVHRRA